tara:strand:+ start:66 stop:461 length:396 start_codon:yes stop_codon:yes gene_type:complete
MSKQEVINFWLNGCSDENVVSVAEVLIGNEFDEQGSTNLIDFNMPPSSITELEDRSSAYSPPTNQDLENKRAQEQDSKRDKLLQESDYTQLPDVPLTNEKRSEWVTYREGLRNISDQSSYPDSVTWPTKPS